ncbi:MAG: ATP-dependent sacrificial sulfur transferase LarE [Deltaproteobacteria bacterium]|nr:ATP-dependent sacrificial sulfur transferase LarE [Deltaproteobacteria bacterium]
MELVLTRLETYISGLGQVMVALSGGVDSALLAFLARKTLPKEKVLAVTGDSASVPSRDRDSVQEFCRQHDIPHRFLPTYEMEDPNYLSNPENRCFFCKQELYRRLKQFAVEKGFTAILDGTQVDDLKGHRPGQKAIEQEGILTPYLTLEMNKAMIRELAAYFQLQVAKKPQAACLSSRIPTGTAIAETALRQIDTAENLLRDLGFVNPRVRFHGDLARLHLTAEDTQRCLTMREQVTASLKHLGFQHVTIDLQVYDRE